MKHGNLLVKLFGRPMTVVFGDAAVIDRYNWLKRNLRRGNLRTLDAGCGSGAFALYAASVGNDTVGISFDDRNNQVATERAGILGLKNAKFITANLNNLGQIRQELGVFDQIICSEVIEHIMDDRKLAKNIAALLKPGGRLLLATPYKYGKFWRNAVVSPVENGDHVRIGYDAIDLGLIFKDAGLEIVKTEYVSGWISQKLILMDGFLNRRIGALPAWLIALPFRIFQGADGLITKLTHYSSLSIAVVAKKV